MTRLSSTNLFDWKWVEGNRISTIQGNTVESNGKSTDQSAANQELLRLCARKDRFIAIAGHELRNVLAPIVTSLDCLVAYSENETQAELLRIAARQAKQLVRLIDDLFDASRLASGKLRLRREAIDMRALAARSIQSVSPAIIDLANNCL
jgi:signal transduction histidine kinase